MTRTELSTTDSGGGMRIREYNAEKGMWLISEIRTLSDGHEYECGYYVAGDESSPYGPAACEAYKDIEKSLALAEEKIKEGIVL